MSGLKPAVIGFVLSTIISVGTTVFFPDAISLNVFRNAHFYVSLAILFLSVFLSFKKVHPILIIVISAVIGIATGYAFM